MLRFTIRRLRGPATVFGCLAMLAFTLHWAGREASVGHVSWSTHFASAHEPKTVAQRVFRITSARRQAGAGGGAQDAAQFIGVVACGRCHNKRGDFDVPEDEAWIAYNESAIWKRDDKHAKAFEVLGDARSQKMAKLLGIPVTEDRRCLSCHANWQTDQRPSTYKFGVTCESCHGPGSKYMDPHQQQDNEGKFPWRSLSAEKKEELGMVDVRNPRKRAEQCLSCHVGNTEQGKVLTHAMYAAGHPPLPSIEIETFAQSMPPHWRYLAEKPDVIKNDERIREALHFDEREVRAARSVAVGSVAAMRESIRYFASGVAQSKSEGSGPDLAQFDCTACHHELARPGWRQRRMTAGNPGRPAARQWPATLIETGVALGVLDNAQQHQGQFRKLLAAFHQGCTARPFGDPEKIGDPGDENSASGELVRWLDDRLDDLDKALFDEAAAKTMLVRLASLPADSIPDYESARQSAWAFRAIYLDMKTRGIQLDESERIELLLADLAERLNLDLPSRQDRQIEDALPKALESMADYDPTEFQRTLEQLAALIEPAS